jgi:hypothetical protein
MTAPPKSAEPTTVAAKVSELFEMFDDFALMFAIVTPGIPLATE